MEDAHTIALDLDEGQEDSNTFFAVYDGHGGGSAAKYAGQNVHKQLVHNEAYQSGQYHAALKNAFLDTDSNMRNTDTFLRQRDSSGCTAVTALCTKDGKILVANAGDSRSVISVKGEVKPLSFDHKPQNEVEKNRIAAAGGYVSFGRVNGNLALARALGDFEYKKNADLSPEQQIITCDPDITEHEITDEDEFLVLACDGIWDCLSSQQVVDVIRRLVSQGKQLPEVCEEICELCLAPDTTGGVGIGCDNMTILIVALLHGRSVEEWHQWITERTNRKYGYNTPEEFPQIYSDHRLSAFRARKEIWAQRDREREEYDTEQRGHEARGIPRDPLEGSVFGGLIRAIGKQNAGITIMPRSGAWPGNGRITDPDQPLMFDGDDDSDEEGESIETEEGDERAQEIRGNNATNSLWAQLEEFERERDEEDSQPGSSPERESSTQHRELQGEAPAPPAPSQHGAGTTKQLISIPGVDAPTPAVEAEGLMDASESPLKV